MLAVMAATAVLVLGISWARAEGTAAQTDTFFTYQGKLVYNGTAANETCDLTFRMYDGVSYGSNQVGLNQYKTNVPVNDGFFTVDLDFGNVFSGDARYLQIEIDSCTNGASGVTLSPMIPLIGAPYALGLRPGTVISGAVAGGSSLKVVNSNPSGGSTYTYGVYGQVDSSGGVHGIAGKINTSDPSAAGVRGWSTTGNASGVQGLTTSSSQFASGVYGVASNNGFGVWSRTDSSTSGSTGVYGNATAANGVTYGVYGSSLSASGYGVYSNGNAHIDGLLTWKPITSYISIPAAAFNPAENGYTFSNVGNTLIPGDASSFSYLAPAQLPQGATVTKVTFHWADGSIDADGYATLYQIDLAGSESIMTNVPTSSSSGTASSSNVTSINNASIDNSRYAYYVWLYLPINNGIGSAYGVVIEYTIDQPY